MSDEREFTVAELAARIAFAQLDFVATLSNVPFDSASDFVCGYVFGLFDALADRLAPDLAGANPGDVVAQLMEFTGRDRAWFEGAADRAAPEFDEGQRTGAVDASEWLQTPDRAPRGLARHVLAEGSASRSH